MMLELVNSFLHIAMPEDGSRLVVEGEGGRYEAADYAFANYGGFIPVNLPAFGKVHVRKSGDELVIDVDRITYYARFPGHSYLKPDPGPDLRFTFRIRLEGDEAVFITEPPQGMDEEHLFVDFPNSPMRWETDKPGYWAGSMASLGMLLRYPSGEQTEFGYADTLPVSGFFTDTGGIGMLAVTPFDWTLQYSANPGAGTVWSPKPVKGAGRCSIRQEFITGKSMYAREVRLKFFPAGQGYVELAKWYRSAVKREGRFVSLADKIAADPEVGLLAGSVIWKHRVYAQEQLPPDVKHDYSLYIRRKEEGEAEGKPNDWTAKEVFDAAHTAGFDRVCIMNCGWNRYGYDSGYPTRFPVNPERGTDADFRQASAYGKSLSPGYIFSMHDNYRDVYRNSPEFDMEEIIHTEDGVPLKGGIWRGGRCHLMCGKCAMKYAERDLKAIGELVGRGAIYIDVMGCTPLYNCYHPDHPGNERDDAAWRIAIFRKAKQYIGALATEGAPKDYLVSTADVGAYPQFRYFTASNVEPIPFFALVYHDSIYNFTGQGVSGLYGAEHVNRVALYGMLPFDFGDASRRISYDLRSTYTAEMLDHEFLAPGLQRTHFADGTVVTVNFSKNAQDGVPAEDFRIEKSR